MVSRAREVLTQLEAGETSNRASRLIDDLPLFSAALRREAPPAPAAGDAVSRQVQALNPDEMTPREALDVLYRLKKMASEGRS